MTALLNRSEPPVLRDRTNQHGCGGGPAGCVRAN